MNCEDPLNFILSVSQMIPTFDAISHFLGRGVKHFDFLCCVHATTHTYIVHTSLLLQLILLGPRRGGAIGAAALLLPLPLTNATTAAPRGCCC